MALVPTWAVQSRSLGTAPALDPWLERSPSTWVTCREVAPSRANRIRPDLDLDRDRYLDRSVDHRPGSFQLHLDRSRARLCHGLLHCHLLVLDLVAAAHLAHQISTWPRHRQHHRGLDLESHLPLLLLGHSNRHPLADLSSPKARYRRISRGLSGRLLCSLSTCLPSSDHHHRHALQGPGRSRGTRCRHRNRLRLRHPSAVAWELPLCKYRRGRSATMFH